MVCIAPCVWWSKIRSRGIAHVHNVVCVCVLIRKDTGSSWPTSVIFTFSSTYLELVAQNTPCSDNKATILLVSKLETHWETVAKQAHSVVHASCSRFKLRMLTNYIELEDLGGIHLTCCKPVNGLNTNSYVYEWALMRWCHRVMYIFSSVRITCWWTHALSAALYQVRKRSMISHLIEIFIGLSQDLPHIKIYFCDVSINNPNIGTLYDDGTLFLVRGKPMTTQIFSSCTCHDFDNKHHWDRQCKRYESDHRTWWFLCRWFLLCRSYWRLKA